MKLEKVLNDNNQSKTKNPDWGMKLKSEKSGVEIVEQKHPHNQKVDEFIESSIRKIGDFDPLFFLLNDLKSHFS
uniref:Uncharacterized protein n=1 Tax=Cucumis sativus TaxID=3659 RepID=A0A0A0LZ59_CUCSA